MIKAKQAFFWTSDLEGFGFHGNKVTILHLTSSIPHVNIENYEWVIKSCKLHGLMSSMAWVKRCYSKKSKNLNKLLVFEAVYP